MLQMEGLISMILKLASDGPLPFISTIYRGDFKRSCNCFE